MRLLLGLLWVLSWPPRFVLGALGITMALRCLVAAAGRLRLRRALKKIRIRQVAVGVAGADGRMAWDRRVYPDTERVGVTASFHVPRALRRRPGLEVACVVRDPGGAERGRQPGVIAVGPRGVGLAAFEFRSGAIVETPGRWRLEVLLVATGCLLAHEVVETVSREALIADLEVRDARLLVVREDEGRVAGVVLEDAHHVLPLVELRPATFAPARCRALSAEVDLLADGGGTPVETRCVPLVPRGRDLRIEGHAWPVARGLAVAPHRAWTYRVRLGGRVLARLPFRVLRREEVLAGVGLQGLDLRGRRRGGTWQEAATLGSSVDPRRTDRVAPAARLRVPHPDLALRQELTFVVSLDGEPVSASTREVRLDREVVEVVPAEYPLPAMGRGDPPRALEFVVLLGDRLLGRAGVQMRYGPERYSDAQGRLDPAALDDAGLDFAAEAARILRQAERAGAVPVEA